MAASRRNADEEARHRDGLIARAIVRYVTAHPLALDTPQGIAEWWISPHEVRADVAQVARVLRQLADDGVLEAVDLRDAIGYRRKRDPDRQPERPIE